LEAPNTGATNESGFSALPAGLRDYWYGGFYGIGNEAMFWSFSENDKDQNNAWMRMVESYESTIQRRSINKNTGGSVRCVVGEDGPRIKTRPVKEITVNSAFGGGEIYGTSEITEWGIVWDITPDPSIDRHLGITSETPGGEFFESVMSDLEANTVYYVRAYAVNNDGVGYGRNYSFKTYLGFVEDIDGNIYYAVMIGNQKWMAENLKTTSYSDGEPIEFPSTNTEWANNTNGAYAWLKNDAEFGSIYGGLYNWYAVNNTNGLCPDGWHVASDDDWIEMEIYLGMDPKFASDNGSRYAEIGGKLKQSGFETWFSPNTGATNETRFTALPGDLRYSSGESYDPGYEAYFWTSTDTEWGNPYSRNLRNNNSYIFRNEYMTKKTGMSVRCIFSEGKPLVFTLPEYDVADNNATIKGYLSYDGGTGLSAVGMVWSKDPNSSPDLELNEGVTIETPVPGIFESKLEGLEPGELYYARAYATSSEGKTGYGSVVKFTTYYGKASDADGNLYYSIKIGDQEWLSTNLRTSSYAGGESILTGLQDSEWAITTEGAFSVYPHESAEGIDSSDEMLDAYGALYNWFAVETGNLCPAGWKVPDEDDWTQLRSYITSNYYGSHGTVLKSCRQVNSPLAYCATSEHPRWNSYNAWTYGRDDLGFGGLPGGMRDDYYGSFYSLGFQGYFWSGTTQSEIDAFTHNLSYLNNNFNSSQSSKKTGLSVRCLKIED
jgi:uncharacterized protein (TIGR02145 family)